MQNKDGKEMAINENKIRGALPDIFAGILLGVCLAWVYGDTFVKILNNETASLGFHSLLVAGISGYIVWRKRESFSTLKMQPSFWAGSFVILLGCMMHVVGKLSYTSWVKEISFVPTLLGVVWLCLGGGYLRELWFPIACLIFMFPFVGEIFGGLSIYLQYVAAWIGAQVIGLTGMTVLLEGQYITLPHIKLEVAKACNGANHIITMVALAVLLAWGDQNSRMKKGFLIFSGALIGILANGLRVGAIGLWSSYYPDRPLHGPGDIFYVSVIFVFALVLLFGVNLALRKWRAQPASSDYLLGRRLGASASWTSLTYPLILSTSLVFGTALFANLWISSPVSLEKPLEEFPKRIGEWIGEDRPPKDGILSNIAADSTLRRVYRNGSGQEVELEIAYCSEQNESKKITKYLNKGPLDNGEKIQIPLNSSMLPINRSEIQDGIGDKLLYSWYYVNGRVFAGRYAAKSASLYATFFQRHSNGAIIAVSAIKGDGLPGVNVELSLRQFLESGFPLIEKWLRPSPANPNL